MQLLAWNVSVRIVLSSVTVFQIQTMWALQRSRMWRKWFSYSAFTKEGCRMLGLYLKMKSVQFAMLLRSQPSSNRVTIIRAELALPITWWFQEPAFSARNPFSLLLAWMTQYSLIYQDLEPNQVKADLQWQEVLLFSTASRPALGPTQPLIQWVVGAVSFRVTAAGARSWPLPLI